MNELVLEEYRQERYLETLSLIFIKQSKIKTTKQNQMEIKLTKGDSITIPEGCTAEIKDGVITFTPQREFEDGDILIDDGKPNEFPHKLIMIYKGKRDSVGAYKSYIVRNLSGLLVRDTCCCSMDHCKIRLATEEEKQELFDALKEKDLYWNAEEKRVEKIRSRARTHDSYWFIDSRFCVQGTTEEEMDIDDKHYESGNYFRTKKDAERFLEIFRESLRKFHQDDQL